MQINANCGFWGHRDPRRRQKRAPRSRGNNAATGPLGRNGAHVPSGCPSVSAMTHKAAGLKPSPTWADVAPGLARRLISGEKGVSFTPIPKKLHTKGKPQAKAGPRPAPATEAAGPPPAD